MLEDCRFTFLYDVSLALENSYLCLCLPIFVSMSLRTHVQREKLLVKQTRDESNFCPCIFENCFQPLHFAELQMSNDFLTRVNFVSTQNQILSTLGVRLNAFKAIWIRIGCGGGFDLKLVLAVILEH